MEHEHPPVDTLLNNRGYSCFRCKNGLWQSIGNDKAICQICRNTNKSKYGIAKLETRDGVIGIHIYVYNDCISPLHGQLKYGGAFHPLRSEEGRYTLLMSSQQYFSFRIRHLLDRDEIPCTVCGSTGEWKRRSNYQDDKNVCYCNLCWMKSSNKDLDPDQKRLLKMGFAKCKRGSSLMIETYSRNHSTDKKEDPSFFHYYIADGVGEWKYVKEEIKDPGYD